MRRHIRHGIVTATALTALTGGLLVSAGTQARAEDEHPVMPGYGDDFNRDGYGDLAIGSPEAWVDVTRPDGSTQRVLEAGYVTVSYGGRYGARRTGLTAVTQDSPGVPGDPVRGGRFGQVIAAGDFDGDGDSDLAVGSRGDQVTLLHGSATGLQAGVRVSDPAAQPGFGSVLKAGDFDNDGFTDLVIGSATSLRVFRGPIKADGTPASVQTLDLGTPMTFPEGAQKRVAVGRINAGGYDDLVVLDEAGRPGRVLLGKMTGPRLTAGTVRGGDSVTIADFDGDGNGDVAVGDSQYTRGTEPAAGRVQVSFGAITGVSQRRATRVVTEATAGVPGTPERDDRFGFEVTAGDLDLDGYADLITTAPGENRPTCETCQVSGGGLYVIKGSATGPTGTGAAFYRHTAAGLPRPAGIYRIASPLMVTDLNSDEQPEITFPVRATEPQIWSVGTRDGKVAGTSPTRVVRPPADPRVGTGDFGVLTR